VYPPIFTDSGRAGRLCHDSFSPDIDSCVTVARHGAAHMALSVLHWQAGPEYIPAIDPR
jgi:hypothetical protein